MSFINGKVALVTGGASGIGFGFVEELLRNGAKGVTLVDIDETKGALSLSDLSKEFGPNRAIFCKSDVTNRSELEDSFSATVEKFGNLDIVVNNAGIVHELDWDKCLAANLGSVISGTLLALDKYLPKYKSTEEAVVVNTASITGLEPISGLPVYSATKFGVVGFSRAIALGNCDNERTRVLTICPGFTVTPLLSLNDEIIQESNAELLSQELKSLTLQSTDNVAKGLIEVINQGKNGSVWVVHKGQPAFQWNFPNVNGLFYGDDS